MVSLGIEASFPSARFTHAPLPPETAAVLSGFRAHEEESKLLTVGNVYPVVNPHCHWINEGSEFWMVGMELKTTPIPHGLLQIFPLLFDDCMDQSSIVFHVPPKSRPAALS